MMKLTLFTESDRPILQKWLSEDEGLSVMAEKANQSIDPALPVEIYLIWVDNTPVGWFSLANIVPRESAKFGVAIADKRGLRVVFKAAVAFLTAAFQIYKFRKIYCNPITEQSKKGALKLGFDKQWELTLDALERKWVK